MAISECVRRILPFLAVEGGMLFRVKWLELSVS